MAAPNPNDVANAFTNHYYQAFDTNPDGLGGLFNERSMMTFEGTQIMGSANILNKLKGLGKVAHTPKTIDIQPSIDGQSIVIFVTGHIKIGGDNPLHYTDFFHLVPNGPGNYYVHNAIFRLNYGM